MHLRRLSACRSVIAILAVALAGFAWLGCQEDRPNTLGEWKAQRARLDATVWADEILAQDYEQTLVSLWDALLEAGREEGPAGKLSVLASLEFGELVVGSAQPVETLDHEIQRFAFGAPTTPLTPADWGTLLESLAGRGYQLVQSEWRHARFFPASRAAPARSQVQVVLHVIDGGADRRLIIDGELEVEWSEHRDAHGNPSAARIDATGLRMWARSGPPAFNEVFTYERSMRGSLAPIHPVLLYDLNRDGLSEIVMVQSMRVLWNRGGSKFRDAPLASHPYAPTEAGVIADLNGDSYPDLLSPRARGDLLLYLGDPKGRFSSEPLEATHFGEPLRGPSALTVGDIDGDGDLDAWLAQYKPPYVGGQMPTPYYDANDGYPAHLLVNDGAGNFSLRTEEAGLAEKRFRRTYANSFVDLDEDDDLDLLVISDFSGIDLYHNDGSGHFVDANATLRADRHLFGMSASFADYNLDGRLDFFVAGMASTTARRLEALGLGRNDRSDIQEMRPRMMFGNRMYLASEDGWREPEFQSQVARTGWTWGVTPFDFDNDGDADIFAANGNISGQSTKDYDVQFWCHDVYDGDSEPNEALGILFGERMKGIRTGTESWDGYQKNHLLMNRAGKGFVNVAFLMGVAHEFDSTSAVSDDLNLDGRRDLVVIEDIGLRGQRLHVYRNGLETDHHWIGVQLREEGNGITPVGASVTVRTAERTHVGRIITGDTVVGQHATTLHFGLGDTAEVERLEVRWLDGKTRTLLNPEIDRYHTVLASEGAEG